MNPIASEKYREISADRGNTTITVLIGCLSLTSFFLFCSVGAQFAVTSREVNNAADASALAGAIELSHGINQPCSKAKRIAQLNESRLTKCTVSGSTVVVSVVKSLPTSRLNNLIGLVSASAKAGF
jgi:secretion/DNA translocation related TadE-like protein